MSKLKIAIFFTYDYSVESLRNSGLFEREMKIYYELYKNYDVDFKFITYDDNLDLQDLYQTFTFISVYDYIKKSRNKIIRLVKSFFVPFKLKKDLKDVDILHQHQLLGSWIPLILKYLLKKPVLVRTGYDAYLFTIQNREPKYKLIFYKLLTSISIKFSDLYTVTSNSDFEFLKNKFLTNSIKIVPNWVEQKKEILSNRSLKKFLMVGRIENQKNYLLAFKFLNKLDSDFEIDIFGSGSEKGMLKNIVKENNLKINFLGNIQHKKLMENYKNYEYFLSTSKFEGNPKTILEALSSECIVFASNILNHSELIEDGVNGFLFNSENELIEKFEFVQNNIELKKTIRNNCKESLKNNSIDKVAELMFLDYDFLMSLR